MEQKFNELFKVKTYDVIGIKKQWRIIYIPNERKMMVVNNYYQAQAINAGRLDGKGIILTRTQAPKAFPDVFINSENDVPSDLPQRTIILKVSPEQYAFCARFGNISAYLRSLIDKEMQKKS